MLADLTPPQRALADYMSELSEFTWCAGWMKGLEYALWKAVQNGPCKYGQGVLTDAHLARLKELSADCGGWIVFDDVHEESFVPLSVWKDELYDPNR